MLIGRVDGEDEGWIQREFREQRKREKLLKTENVRRKDWKFDSEAILTEKGDGGKNELAYSESTHDDADDKIKEENT
jgi:hypothetical protein